MLIKKTQLLKLREVVYKEESSAMECVTWGPIWSVETGCGELAVTYMNRGLTSLKSIAHSLSVTKVLKVEKSGS